MIRLVAGAAALAAGMSLATLAHADHADAAAPCMTRPEFGRIHHGQTQATVSRIVGAPGKVTYVDSSGDGYRWVSRSWRVCGSRYGFATVDFSTTERTDGQPGVYGKSFYA